MSAHLDNARVVDMHRYREVRDGTEPWITKQEIARHIGYSPRWVEYRVKGPHPMPHQRMGGRLRFRRSAVERWLANQEDKAS